MNGVRYVVVSAEDLTHNGEKYGITFDMCEAIVAGGMHSTSEAAYKHLQEHEKAGTPAKMYRVELVNQTAAADALDIAEGNLENVRRHTHPTREAG